MKAQDLPLIQLLQGAKQFIIPIFQRTYSWEIEHCQQLWDDILRVGSDEQQHGHFIGSVVYIAEQDVSANIPRWLVIDGQQRLTTITLLLLAFCKKLKSLPSDAIDVSVEELEDYYLKNRHGKNDLRYKMLLTKNDREALIALMDDRALPERTSEKITQNYQFFKDKLTPSNISHAYLGFKKLMIVDVSLSRGHDDPQMIFESLNSTGLDLSQADLIRNFVLMRQEPDAQVRLYEEYWYPMEQAFTHEYLKWFNNFMRDFLTVRTGNIPRLDKVYEEFKKYVRNIKSTEPMDEVEKTRCLLADVCGNAKYYVAMVLPTEKDKDLRTAFEDIKTLKVDVSYPFLLEVYGDYREGKITKEGVLEILRLVEAYVFRRAICGIQPNSMNKTFATLMREVDKENYLESIKVAFLKKDSYRRFPSDSEFKKEFVIKDVYNFRSRNYLLSRLENHGRKERVEVEGYTIEHVMPQKPDMTEEWKKELGENWSRIQETYLHTIGNLTLTGYNSELSYKPFIDKRAKLDGGFQDSPLRLNRSLATAERWNEESIKKRAEELAEKAAELWRSPVVSEEALHKLAKVKAGAAEKQYDIKDYEYLAGDMFALYEQFRLRVLNLDASVTEEFKKLYIAYKLTTNFVDVVPQKNRLRLSLNMKFNEIDDPKEWCKDITGLGRWGNGDVEVGLSSVDDLDYVMHLVKQSFEKQIEADELL